MVIKLSGGPVTCHYLRHKSNISN